LLQFTKFKYCPKCGSPDITTVHTNGMKCSLCGFIYFHNTASAVAALIETPAGVLFVERNHDPRKGFLDVPGGFVDYHESLEYALRREIKEELTFDIPSLEYFGSFPNEYVYEEITYFTTDTFFKCTLPDIPRLVPNDEICDYAYFKKDSIPFGQLAFKSSVEAFMYYRSI
jgi:NADH pyrophosphatase NudC (nudix superfamily)